LLGKLSLGARKSRRVQAFQCPGCALPPLLSCLDTLQAQKPRSSGVHLRRKPKKAIPIARTSANMVIFILKNRRFSPEYCQPASKLQGPQPTPQKKLVLFRRIEQI
jgi:hypothetical protein